MESLSAIDLEMEIADFESTVLLSDLFFGVTTES
jgi:hypothetical protein